MRVLLDAYNPTGSTRYVRFNTSNFKAKVENEFNTMIAKAIQS